MTRKYSRPACWPRIAGRWSSKPGHGRLCDDFDRINAPCDARRGLGPAIASRVYHIWFMPLTADLSVVRGSVPDARAPGEAGPPWLE